MQQTYSFKTMTEDECWRASVERDARFDGVYVLAVVTTGIYCRPSCSARMPYRKNVRYFENNAAARQAGFRACKRCQPDEVPAEAALVEALCRYIDEHLDEAPTLADMGRAMSVSPTHLQRVFKRVMGISPREYAESLRMDRLKDHLKEGKSVTDAIYEVGFGSASRVYEQAPAHLGMTPATYANGGSGVTIHYTLSDTALGRMLVGGTERGIAFIAFDDRDGALVEALEHEFPDADLTRDEGDFAAWVAALTHHLDGDRPELSDLPLDIRATAFQRRVWDALQRIPEGETRTYAEVAESIGQPTAARAVARACATNPVPIVIPCHRVVRTDGGMGGYRWGMSRKRALLERERVDSRMREGAVERSA